MTGQDDRPGGDAPPGLVHLVRHGEVHNPDHIVYAALDGFGLSTTGWSQAESSADRLRLRPIACIVSSPLQRAVETASVIARHTGAPVDLDPRLTEWGLSHRWAGTVWDDLPQTFPGELEAYLATPHDLPFSPESIQTAANRVVMAMKAAHRMHPDGDVVVVSHQDPIQAGRLQVQGKPLSALNTDKPGHACIITFEPGDHWFETAYWEPHQPARFPPETESDDAR